MTPDLNLSLYSWQDVIDTVAETVGDGFLKVIALTQKILDNPEEYTGPQAAMAAIKLAAYRTQIGVVGQYYKLKSANTKIPHDRLIKDALLAMFTSLEEQINTLKLVARHDREILQYG